MEYFVLVDQLDGCFEAVQLDFGKEVRDFLERLVLNQFARHLTPTGNPLQTKVTGAIVDQKRTLASVHPYSVPDRAQAAQGKPLICLGIPARMRSGTNAWRMLRYRDSPACAEKMGMGIGFPADLSFHGHKKALEKPPHHAPSEYPWPRERSDLFWRVFHDDFFYTKNDVCEVP